VSKEILSHTKYTIIRTEEK